MTIPNKIVKKILRDKTGKNYINEVGEEERDLGEIADWDNSKI